MLYQFYWFMPAVRIATRGDRVSITTAQWYCAMWFVHVYVVGRK